MAIVEELERLSALRDKGSITEAEFEQAKARILNPPDPGRVVRTYRRGFPSMRRSATDRWFGGVCGGIAKVTDTETWIWRLIFTAGLVFGGITALLYLLFWIFVPPEEPGLPA